MTLHFYMDPKQSTGTVRAQTVGISLITDCIVASLLNFYTMLKI